MKDEWEESGFSRANSPLSPQALCEFDICFGLGYRRRDNGAGNALIQALAIENFSREHRKMRVTYFHVAFTAP